MTITDWKYWKSKWDDERLHSKALEAMVRRAKEERDQFAEQAAARDNRDRDMQEIMRINNELVAERDDIRRKTIEECAKWLEDMPEHWRTLAAEMRRALAQTDDGKTETEK